MLPGYWQHRGYLCVEWEAPQGVTEVEIVGIELVEQMGGHYRRLLVRVDERPAWAWNPGSDERDFSLQRPTVHPLYTPDGVPVTEHGAHNRVHHRGVWIGHAKVNGVNLFHDGPGTGRIRASDWSHTVASDRLTLFADLVWESESDEPIARESRVYTFFPDRPYGTFRAHRLDIRSSLAGEGGRELRLGRDSHAFCGMRVVDCLDEDDGGVVANSEGHTGEAEAMGQTARWVSCSGRVGLQQVGAVLMVHPASPPQPFFVRSYGTILANLCLEREVVVAPGEALVQKFSVIAHDGPADHAAIDRMWQDFADSEL